MNGAPKNRAGHPTPAEARFAWGDARRPHQNEPPGDFSETFCPSISNRTACLSWLCFAV